MADGERMAAQEWIAVASVADTLIVLWALYARAQVRATREEMEAQSRLYVPVLA